MGYFDANTDYPEAQHLLYIQFPEHYVWEKNVRRWKPRQYDFAIGHLHFASLASGECFHLHTLLTVTTGARSFYELKSFEGRQYPTFKAASLAHGLLEDDQEWALCLQEAVVMQTGSQLRRLFASILLHCVPSHPSQLWDQFRQHICDDLHHHLQHQCPFGPPLLPVSFHHPSLAFFLSFPYGVFLSMSWQPPPFTLCLPPASAFFHLNFSPLS